MTITLKRLIRKIVLAMTALLVLLALFGVAYERIGQHQAVSEFPAPGQMVDIGGRRIQLDCRGSGSPTVVFESGLDLSGSLSWSAVHDPVAQHTRACAYSRAGMMWSDPVDGPVSAKRVAEDLHAVLNKAGEHAPFVMVGHSLGGPYVMTYTKYFGADVAGLVFVDASHPEQVARTRAVMPEPSTGALKVVAALGWSGAVRAAAPLLIPQSPNQPASQAETVRAYASTSLRALSAENDALDSTLAEAGTFRQLGSRPLFVMTAMKPLSPAALATLKMTPEQGAQLKAVWKELQDDEATWSSQSKHQLLVNSDHYIQFDDPAAVVQAVRFVVDQVRADGAVKP
ncbi:alpha/beta hydrolase [Xylophilus sp. GW821-FHT01B05]